MGYALSDAAQPARRAWRLSACLGAQEGENDLYPTVYLLWAFPKALDSLLTYSEVSPKILGGADLMLQGVHPAQATPASGAGSWEEDDKRSVILPDNHFPFGVGSMVVSSASLAKTGLKGRGLKLLHHYPDTCVPSVQQRWLRGVR